MKPCCIIYGSETGSTEIASHTTYNYLRSSGVGVEIHLADLVDLDLLLSFEYVVFFVPTSAFGEFPHNFESLVTQLLSHSSRNRTLAKLKYTVFGLGDSRYPQYNFAARRLQSLLKELKGVEFFPAGLGDDQHKLGYDGELIVWRKDLAEYLKKELKGKESVNKHEDEIYPFKVIITPNKNRNKSESGPGSVGRKWDNVEGSCYKGVVKYNKVISGENHFSKVRTIAIEGRTKKHRTGDVLCVFPTDQEARQMLKNIQIDPEQAIKIKVTTNSNVQTILSVHNQVCGSWSDCVIERIKSLALGKLGEILKGCKENCEKTIKQRILSSRELPLEAELSLGELFERYLCLRNLCTPTQMRVMAQYTEDQLHREKLEEMSSDTVEGLVEYYRYCKSERRSLYEVLYDFPSLKLPLEVLINISTPYYSRMYSIASSELGFEDKYGYLMNKYPTSMNYRRFKEFLDFGGTKTPKMELIVGDVVYRTPMSRSVEGLTSKYLSNLKEQDEVEYLIYKPGFASVILNLQVPVLFISTGTGVTVPKPYIEQRSFKFKELWNRHRVCPRRRDMAFMGFRRPSQDHLYSDYQLFENWCKFVFVYSRTGTRKFYVQDALRIHSKEVYPFLREGLVVIGGRSHPMPSDVLEALREVLEREAGFGSKSAQRFLDESIKQNKIIIDTWG